MMECSQQVRQLLRLCLSCDLSWGCRLGVLCSWWSSLQALRTAALGSKCSHQAASLKAQGAKLQAPHLAGQLALQMDLLHLPGLVCGPLRLPCAVGASRSVHGALTLS